MTIKQNPQTRFNDPDEVGNWMLDSYNIICEEYEDVYYYWILNRQSDWTKTFNTLNEVVKFLDDNYACF